MSETPQSGPQHGAGKTGGLPGANADPATATSVEDEIDAGAGAGGAPVENTSSVVEGES